ncbi:hypothetical protein PINS_up004068 [Pythium insidiosum]|nr:hypothetical protein PINS_up004068 [Pythium insidiosum]
MAANPKPTAVVDAAPATEETDAGKKPELEAESKMEPAPPATTTAPVTPTTPATGVSSSPRAAPVSLLGSSSTTPMPFFVAPARQPTKAEYEAQLQQLRARQAALREQLRRPNGAFQSTEQIQLEIQQIDYQKAQLKQVIKKL